MQTKRAHWTTAGVLLTATALVGAIAGGSPRAGIDAGVADPFGGPKTGPVSFTGTLDRRAVLRGGDGVARMELVIAADEIAAIAQRRRSTDLVIVLDRSGSMAGEKIVHARAAVRELVEELRPDDRFSLVSYASDARVEVPLTEVGGGGRELIARTIGRLGTGGGTNMSSGLDLAFSLIESARSAGRVPHLILISDGLANEGDPTPQGLSMRAGRAARAEFMLSTIGVGTDFNEQLMTTMADAGTGNYYYVQHAEDLASVFAQEFDAARTTVATGLTLRIEPAPGVRVTDVSGYPLESDNGAVVVRPGSLFSGQQRRIWVSLAVPNQQVGDYQLGAFALSYTSEDGRHSARFDDVPTVACVAGENEYYSRVDPDAWSRSVTVEQYNVMQDDVAKKVKEGKREEALGRLRLFRDQVSAQNRHIESAPVADALVGVDELEDEVRAAFEGDGAAVAEQQNLLGKSKAAAALDGRRVGAKKGAR